MKTIRFALVTVGAIALVFAYATVRTTASAAPTGCDSFKGHLTETTVPSPNDPLGRVIGALSNGRVKGHNTSRFAAITAPADGGFRVATDEIYVPSAGKNLTGTAVMRPTPDPSSSGAYLAEE